MFTLLLVAVAQTVWGRADHPHRDTAPGTGERLTQTPSHPQHIHINTDTLVTYLRWTSEKNLIFHGLTICLLPYRLQLGEKEGRTEEKQMSTREQWVKLCCQSLETTSAAQQDNCRALQQCWQLPPCTVPLCAEEAKSHTP